MWATLKPTRFAHHQAGGNPKARVLSNLEEAATKEIAVNRDAHDFDENKSVAKMDGKIAGTRNKQVPIPPSYGKRARS